MSKRPIEQVALPEEINNMFQEEHRAWEGVSKINFCMNVCKILTVKKLTKQAIISEQLALLILNHLIDLGYVGNDGKNSIPGGESRVRFAHASVSYPFREEHGISGTVYVDGEYSYSFDNTLDKNCTLWQQREFQRMKRTNPGHAPDDKNNSTDTDEGKDE